MLVLPCLSFGALVSFDVSDMDMKNSAFGERHWMRQRSVSVDLKFHGKQGTAGIYIRSMEDLVAEHAGVDS